jgi:hypothetical protein
MKKVWKKPKLVGIYRPQPLESVLTSCKNSSEPTSNGPENSVSYCQVQDPERPGNCGCDCHSCILS